MMRKIIYTDFNTGTKVLSFLSTTDPKTIEIEKEYDSYLEQLTLQ